MSSHLPSRSPSRRRSRIDEVSVEPSDHAGERTRSFILEPSGLLEIEAPTCASCFGQGEPGAAVGIDGLEPLLHRSRFSLPVPCLALLLGLLVAAPAQSPTVWSATLTVKAFDGDHGYGNTGASGCNKALDEHDFTHDTTDYDVYAVVVSAPTGGGSYLNLLLGKTIPDAIKGLKQCVGTTGYALSAGTVHGDEPVNDNNAVRWTFTSGGP